MCMSKFYLLFELLLKDLYICDESIARLLNDRLIGCFCRLSVLIFNLKLNFFFCQNYSSFIKIKACFICLLRYLIADQTLTRDHFPHVYCQFTKFEDLSMPVCKICANCHQNISSRASSCPGLSK